MRPWDVRSSTLIAAYRYANACVFKSNAIGQDFFGIVAPWTCRRSQVVMQYIPRVGFPRNIPSFFKRFFCYVIPYEYTREVLE